jgi:hypothetical protein
MEDSAQYEKMKLFAKQLEGLEALAQLRAELEGESMEEFASKRTHQMNPDGSVATSSLLFHQKAWGSDAGH